MITAEFISGGQLPIAHEGSTHFALMPSKNRFKRTKSRYMLSLKKKKKPF